MFVFRVDGRSGQGVESATRIIGRAGFLAGFKTQDFFLAGLERRGSHVTGIVKMDKYPILSRQTEPPDFLMVMDMTLEVDDIIRCIKDGGVALFNTKERPNMAYLKKHKIKHYHVDATNIALATMNRAIPNTVMVGALAKIFGRISLKNMKRGTEAEIGLDELNKKAIDEGYRGVKK
jgi:pyruvate ferredoxin oxidoreductase gamma subunit